MEIRKYKEEDIPAMLRIWNQVVRLGTIPQAFCSYYRLSELR